MLFHLKQIILFKLIQMILFFQVVDKVGESNTMV